MISSFLPAVLKMSGDVTPDDLYSQRRFLAQHSVMVATFVSNRCNTVPTLQTLWCAKIVVANIVPCNIAFKDPAVARNSSLLYFINCLFSHCYNVIKKCRSTRSTDKGHNLNTKIQFPSIIHIPEVTVFTSERGR